MRKGRDKVAEGGAPRQSESAHGGVLAEAAQELDLEGSAQLDARSLVTDLPHGAPIRCVKGKALSIRYDRVVTATWGRYTNRICKGKSSQGFRDKSRRQGVALLTFGGSPLTAWGRLRIENQDHPVSEKHELGL